MKDNMPSHVGIIMDGNGRWALRHGLARTQGHAEGVRATKQCVRAAIAHGIQYLSLYVFSTENWSRSNEEIEILFKLITNNLRKEEQFYVENGIRVVHSGSKDGMPDYVVDEIMWAEERTRLFNDIVVNLAINYGGQEEIVRAVNRFYQHHDTHTSISVADIRERLDTPLLPNLDFIIRTGGEHRLSNFLLWESAYAELYFSDKLWPDWQQHDLEIALQEYASRHRSFGGKRVVCNTG